MANKYKRIPNNATDYKHVESGTNIMDSNSPFQRVKEIDVMQDEIEKIRRELSESRASKRNYEVEKDFAIQEACESLRRRLEIEYEEK